jgi:DNA-binding MarR family transcriptional regulator
MKESTSNVSDDTRIDDKPGPDLAVVEPLETGTSLEGLAPAAVVPAADDPTASEPMVAALLREIAPLLAHRWRGFAAHCVRRSISMMHLHLLSVLDDGSPMPMSRIAEILGVSLSSATGIVTRMEERGLVERTHDRDDRRLVLVRLTPAGRAESASLAMAGRDCIAAIIRDMPGDQQRMLLDGMRGFSNSVHRHVLAHARNEGCAAVVDPASGTMRDMAGTAPNVSHSLAVPSGPTGRPLARTH